MKILLTILFFSISLSSFGDVVYYFGDSHSTKTPLGSKLEAFLSSPAQHCEDAVSPTNSVVKLNGNGLDPRHWVSTAAGSTRFIQKVLEQRVASPKAGLTTLDQLLVDRANNLPEKIVLEFGDNSLPGNLSNSFKTKIIQMIQKLNVSSFRDCLIIAPQPNVKAAYKQAKIKILEDLYQLNQDKICQVVFFDESNGKLPLTDGIHTTFNGYKVWANQLIKNICKLDFL